MDLVQNCRMNPAICHFHVFGRRMWKNSSRLIDTVHANSSEENVFEFEFHVSSL